MSRILVQEAANLFCGDHDPTASQHLVLSELALPALQELYQDHHAGGSPVKIEIPVGIEKLTPTFKLVGHQPEVMTLFGLGASAVKNFTAYGVLRDKQTAVAQQIKAVMTGRLGKVEQEAFKRGELQHHDYAINGVVRYLVEIDGVEQFFWDFYTAEWRVAGVSQNDEKRLLNIPG